VEIFIEMKRFFLLLFAAAMPTVWAQTASQASTTSTSSAKSSSTPAGAKSAASTAASAPWIKLPAGIPRVPHGPVKLIPITEHYEDIKIGAGAEGESGKVWHLKYTGWRATDGVEFDSWDQHARPAIGKDGKPELDPDGKPKMSDPEPAAIPQGIGGTIPGFDFGIAGMHIGGKRRIFIPWQLGYGTRSVPDRPGHPGIPAKSDLIFDVELVDVTEMPQRPMMPHPMPAQPHPGTGAPPASAPTAPPPPPAGSGSTPATPPSSAPPQK
jgi:peptidylprolyl isomerase